MYLSKCYTYMDFKFVNIFYYTLSFIFLVLYQGIKKLTISQYLLLFISICFSILRSLSVDTQTAKSLSLSLTHTLFPESRLFIELLEKFDNLIRVNYYTNPFLCSILVWSSPPLLTEKTKHRQ